MCIRNLLRMALFISFLMQGGCDGGGSEGTGLESSTRSIEGRIVTADGSPVAAAAVTILETGERAVSDQQGEFEIFTSSTSESLELEVEKENQSVRVTIASLSDDTQGVRVTVEFDPTVEVVPVDRLEVSVKIVGACDIYFENKRTIRQANTVPEGARCTIKVVTKSGGKPIGNVAYGLRYRGCSDDSQTTELVAGLTSEVFNPGVGQVTFEYIDDSEHCVYEVVVPYKQSSVRPIVYRIVTFTKQRSVGREK